MNSVFIGDMIGRGVTLALVVYFFIKAKRFAAQKRPEQDRDRRVKTIRWICALIILCQLTEAGLAWRSRHKTFTAEFAKGLAQGYSKTHDPRLELIACAPDEDSVDIEIRSTGPEGDKSLKARSAELKSVMVKKMSSSPWSRKWPEWLELRYTYQFHDGTRAIAFAITPSDLKKALSAP